jgi:hypothetical protein
MHEQSRVSGGGARLVASCKVVVLVSFVSFVLRTLKVRTVEHGVGADFIGL